MIKIDGASFSIETKNIGYYLYNNDLLIENLHFGSKIRANSEILKEQIGVAYGTDISYEKKRSEMSLLHLCLELTPTQKGDFRQSAIDIELANGSRVCDFKFVNAQIIKGNVPLQGMPSSYGAKETLKLNFEAQKGLQIAIYYTPYEECDVITKRIEVINNTGDYIKIHKCLSYQLDLHRQGLKLYTYTGAWSRERNETCTPLNIGVSAFGSTSGMSSQYCNPFFMVAQKDANEHYGDVYAFNLIYSGSHYGHVETGPYLKTRIMAGIQPSGFLYTLKNSESFSTPEAVMSYANGGKNAVSLNMHEFVKNHIIRGEWKEKQRPVLLNNWEATYFDFTQSKLLKLAKEAKNLGIELFVLDDGWFGVRDSDKRGLGDYNVNKKKLPDGLKGLADKINNLGMSFGLWMEPEMVSVESELYKAHPDWAVKAPGIEPSEGRNQLVLDLCKKDVQDYIITNVNNTIKSANISYVKWDMNRPLTDCYSDAIEEQGRFAHEWVLGLYNIFTQVVNANPTVLFEACASGGNRFDLGILCYMPQIWTSDDTDAYERLKIQTGTSYGYPLNVLGAHVSACPNHQTTRTSPIETRFNVASFGLLGYELDVTQISAVEKRTVIQQIEFYKKHRDLLVYGDFIRLETVFENSEHCSWMVVSKDKTKAMVLYAIGRLTPNQECAPIILKGLDKNTKYSVAQREQFLDIKMLGSLINHVLPVKVNANGVLVKVASDNYMFPCEKHVFTAYGDLLMSAGLKAKQNFTGTGHNENVRMMPDYSSRVYYLEKCD